MRAFSSCASPPPIPAPSAESSATSSPTFAPPPASPRPPPPPGDPVEARRPPYPRQPPRPRHRPRHLGLLLSRSLVPLLPRRRLRRPPRPPPPLRRQLARIRHHPGHRPPPLEARPRMAPRRCRHATRRRPHRRHLPRLRLLHYPLRLGRLPRRRPR